MQAALFIKLTIMMCLLVEQNSNNFVCGRPNSGLLALHLRVQVYSSRFVSVGLRARCLVLCNTMHSDLCTVTYKTTYMQSTVPAAQDTVSLETGMCTHLNRFKWSRRTCSNDKFQLILTLLC